MASLRELLNNPKFNKFMHERAEAWLNTENLTTQPTVVFDRSPNDFWTTVINSNNSSSILEQITVGNLIPINADALADIAQVHTTFHTYLDQGGVVTIPTIVNVNEQSEIIGNKHQTNVIPNVYVKKISYKDGESLSHGGAGVSVVKIDEQHLPKNHFELLQPFIIPPDDYIRDIRVYIVGGQPVTGLVRKACEPLREENLSGEVLPSENQYPTAIHPGINEVLTDDLKAKIYPLAKRIAEILDLKVRTFRHRSYSPWSTFGFGSIDFLLDSNGQPRPVDFDIGPSVSHFENIPTEVVQGLGDYLVFLSGLKNTNRQIMVIDFPDQEFTIKLADYLQSQQASVTFKESLLYDAVFGNMFSKMNNQNASE